MIKTFIKSLALALPAVICAQDVAVSPTLPRINCDERGSFFCIDRYNRQNYEGEYVGHDEPAINFYSNVAGSGSQAFYTMVLPKDPPTKPTQDGMGGTYNFQLHPTFWFGMALCDSQSAPAPNKARPCTPNSDDNIFTGTVPGSPRYLGNHPGAAFMELQFYPPGWIATPGVVSSNRYFAALNIFSLSVNTNTGFANNQDCRSKVGDEPGNFAILTRTGVPLEPANPLGVPFGSSNPSLSNVLLMAGGDTVRVVLLDTPNGLLAEVDDLTTGQSGFIIAGPAAGFGQVDYNPLAATCTVSPYTFRPMYNTSSEETFVPWAIHTSNISFADEIGHFEFCNDFDRNPASPNFLRCTKPGVQEPTRYQLDDDDDICVNPSFFGFSSSYIDVIGCIAEDLDFDGSSYRENWPGSGPAGSDARLHGTPIMFTSPRFFDPSGTLRNYDRIAFETDLPAITPGCDSRGNGCVGLPGPGIFYPIFSTMPGPNLQCFWQFGGPNPPGVVNNFGGTVDSEYGPLVTREYASSRGIFRSTDLYRNVLSNPCRNFGPI